MSIYLSVSAWLRPGMGSLPPAGSEGPVHLVLAGCGGGSNKDNNYCFTKTTVGWRHGNKFTRICGYRIAPPKTRNTVLTSVKPY